MKLSLFYVIILIVGGCMKKHIKLLMMVLVLFVSLFSLNRITNVKADSGWDSSYSSGGSSWGGGSSWSSSDSSWSSSSYSSYRNSSDDLGDYQLDDDTIIVYVIVFVYLFALWVSHLINNKTPDVTRKSNLTLPDKVKSDEEIQAIISKYINKTITELEAEFCEKFVKVQNAWMNFDYDSLKKLCSNEIYNTYYEELEALKIKHQQNIMSNFAKYKDTLLDVKVENNILIVQYYLLIEFYDYVIDVDSGKVVKGTKKDAMFNAYKLEFSMNVNKLITSCPNCGGSIEPGTTTCEHCKAVIVQDSNEFIMSNKRRI